MTKFMGHWLDESNDERIYIYPVDKSDNYNIRFGWDGKDYTKIETYIPIYMNSDGKSAIVMMPKYFEAKTTLRYRVPYDYLVVENNVFPSRTFKRVVSNEH